VPSLHGFDRVKFLDDSVEAILINDETKGKYLSMAGTVDKLFKAALPDRAANDFYQSRTFLVVLADKIRSCEPEADISQIMARVEQLLDESIATEGYVIHDPKGGEYKDRYADLSKIDFEALKAHFASSRKRTEAQKLRAAIHNKLLAMVRLNKARMDYLEKFQKMIDEYNAGSANVEEFFRKLTEFAKGLTQEEQRAIKENLTEEELAIFDLLTKPDMKLTKNQEQEVKKVGKELLETLKREKLVLDWRKRQQSRAGVRQCIEVMLDRLPPVYAQEVYHRKCEAVYQHIYDCYFGERQSAYSFAE
jgi:type I restriction enzyme R subunit